MAGKTAAGVPSGMAVVDEATRGEDGEASVPAHRYPSRFLPESQSHHEDKDFAFFNPVNDPVPLPYGAETPVSGQLPCQRFALFLRLLSKAANSVPNFVPYSAILDSFQHDPRMWDQTDLPLHIPRSFLTHSQGMTFPSSASLMLLRRAAIRSSSPMISRVSAMD